MQGIGKSVAATRGAPEGQVVSATDEGATFSVCVRFRRSRLKLAKRIPSLDEAIAFADGVRRDRFHSPEDVFVIDERSGVVVNERGDGEPGPESPMETTFSGELAEQRRPGDTALEDTECLDEIFEHAERAIEAARHARERHAAALDLILTAMREASLCDPAELSRLERGAKAAHKQALRSFDDMSRTVEILKEHDARRS